MIKQLTDWLTPLNPYLNLILIGVIVLALIGIFHKDPKVKTFIAAWLVSP